jgi:hypothetical protein
MVSLDNQMTCVCVFVVLYMYRNGLCVFVPFDKFHIEMVLLACNGSIGTLNKLEG